MPAALLLLLAVLLGACSIPVLPDTASAPPLRAVDVERRVHEATNAARQGSRLSALTFDAAASAVARRHSADMARRGYFSHTSPDGADANARAARDGLACRVTAGRQMRVGFAENLAQVWRFSRWRETRSVGGAQRTYEWRTSAEVARETVDGWLGSPGHRRNLLGPATREGIGVAVADDGAVYVTQVLC